MCGPERTSPARRGGPPGLLTRAESKELNRRRLLESARELLIEHGYGALSARQVSARAGVAQSSFYAHFRDKEDLVRTLSEEIFSRLRRQLRESRRDPRYASWSEVLEQTLQRLSEFFWSERELVALLFQELDQPGSPLNEIGQEIFETIHEDFREDLHLLIRQGRVPENLPVEAVVSLVIGTAVYLMRRILQGHIQDPAPVFRDLLVLNGAMLSGLQQVPSSVLGG